MSLNGVAFSAAGVARPDLVKGNSTKRKNPPATPLPAVQPTTRPANPELSSKASLAFRSHVRLHAAPPPAVSSVAARFGSSPYSSYLDAGDVILGIHPPNDELDRLEDWRQRIWTEATRPRPGLEGRDGKPRGWLDPFQTEFVMVNGEDLIEAASRGGFVSRYPHWSHGQQFYHMYEPQRRNLSKLYELVINNNPSYAFMLNTNQEYEQAVVMAHVFGHTDFFKHNRLFEATNRNMTQEMGDHRRIIQTRYIANPSIGYENVEKFIDKAHSIQWLIDLAVDSPPPLFKPKPVRLPGISAGGPPKPVADPAASQTPESDLPEWMNSWVKPDVPTPPDPAKLKPRSPLTPVRPTRDVLGFLVEHGEGMPDWQRDVLSMIRSESYYFAPQLKTKIMNEGWASFWHCKLMQETPSLQDDKHAVEISKMIAGVFRPQKTQLNPYLMGYTIFQDIYERWSKGRHADNPEYMAIRDMDAKRNYDNGGGEVAGLKKIQEVRREDSDEDFIRKYFTEDIANKLNMYTWRAYEDYRGTPRKVISSKEFEEIRKSVLDGLENGGQPIIEVVDGNFRGRRELRLRHVHKYDLQRDYAETTLLYIKSMWGRNRVHLDTLQKDPKNDQYFPVRITADTIVRNVGGKAQPVDVIKRFRLNEKGETLYEIDANGKKL